MKQILLNLQKQKKRTLENAAFQIDIISYIRHMEIDRDAFLIINQLLKTYGFCVIYNLKYFYQKIESHSRRVYESQLVKIQFFCYKYLISQQQFVNFQELFFIQTRSKKLKYLMNNDQLEQGSKLVQSSYFKSYTKAMKTIQKDVYLLIYQYKREKCVSEQQFLQKIRWLYEDIEEKRKSIGHMNEFQLQYNHFLMKSFIDIFNTLLKKAKSFEYLNLLKKIINNINQALETNKPLKQLINDQINQSNLKGDFKYHKSTKKKYHRCQSVNLKNDRQVQILQNEESDNSTYIGAAELIPFTPLCCRTYLIFGEKIIEPESIYREYKGFNYPFDKEKIKILTKTIVAFLNGKGGEIYIGIQETQQKERKVIGMTLTEDEKEIVLKIFRNIADKIHPDIITNYLFRVQFVPLRRHLNGSFYLGKFVVKVLVQCGKSNKLYSYINQLGQYSITFRTENQIVSKDLKKDFPFIYSIMQDRIKNGTVKIRSKDHQGSCKDPEIGIPIFNRKNEKQKQNKSKKKSKSVRVNNFKIEDYKQRQIYRQNQIEYQPQIVKIRIQLIQTDRYLVSEHKFPEYWLKRLCLIPINEYELIQQKFHIIKETHLFKNLSLNKSLVNMNVKWKSITKKIKITSNKNLVLSNICQKYSAVLQDNLRVFVFNTLNQSLQAFIQLRKQQIMVDFL